MKWFLYLSAALLIFIPISIVLMSDTITFSSTFSKIVISTGIILVIFGKVLSLLEKRKENKSFSTDIGIITGLLIALVARFV
nr:histidine kinase [Bacillus suaedae]